MLAVKAGLSFISILTQMWRIANLPLLPIPWVTNYPLILLRDFNDTCILSFYTCEIIKINCHNKVSSTPTWRRGFKMLPLKMSVFHGTCIMNAEESFICNNWQRGEIFSSFPLVSLYHSCSSLLPALLKILEFFIYSHNLHTLS